MNTSIYSGTPEKGSTGSLRLTLISKAYIETKLGNLTSDATETGLVSMRQSWDALEGSENVNRRPKKTLSTRTNVITP